MDDESFNESDTELEWPCFMRNSFLKTLETLPQLWDPTHKHFKNRIKRTKAFEKLLDVHKQQNPKATIDIVRRKVQWILAYHRKILRKIVQAKERGEEFKPRCQFLALQFLRKSKNYNDSCDENYIQNKESIFEDPTDFNCTCGSRKAFIETLEKLPVLWDPCHIYYKHQKKRNEALNKLLKVERKFNPGASIDFVRRKVYWLISNYTRTYKQIEEARRNGETFKPKWQFQALKFLIKRMIMKDHSFREESDNSESYEYEYLDLSDDEASTTAEYLEVSHKRKRVDFDSHSEHSRPIAPVALVWSEKLNSLEGKQRILAEKAINDILFSAQLNSLRGEHEGCAAARTWRAACAALKATHAERAWAELAAASPPDSVWHSLTNCVAYQAGVWQGLVLKGAQDATVPAAFRLAVVLRHTPPELAVRLLADLLRAHPQARELTSYIVSLLTDDSPWCSSCSADDEGASAPLRDLQLFGDCEAAVLAASREEYDAHAKRQRAAYSATAPRHYVELRIKVLNRLVQAPRIFHTPEFQRFEAAARENVEREICTLREHLLTGRHD